MIGKKELWEIWDALQRDRNKHFSELEEESIDLVEITYGFQQLMEGETDTERIWGDGYYRHPASVAAVAFRMGVVAERARQTKQIVNGTST